jgi:hypothetical protein
MTHQRNPHQRRETEHQKRKQTSGRSTAGTDTDEADGTNVASEIETPETESTLDQIFSVLQNQRRRDVIEYLGRTDGPVSLGELAEQIAGWENDKEPRLVGSRERKRVYVALYQSHLPKMEEAGAITYQKDRGIVGEGDEIDRFRAYVDDSGLAESISRRLYRILVQRPVRIVLHGS